MKTKDLISRYVFGYSAGGKSSTHTAGWSFGTDTRRGRIAYRVYSWLTDLRYLPHHMRHALADKLAWASISLRRAKPVRFGWHEDEYGNRAAMLQCEIAIDLAFLTPGMEPHQHAQINRIQDLVCELADLKGAVCWNDWERAQAEDKAQQPTSGKGEA